MGPIRLAIIAGLIYLIYRLLTRNDGRTNRSVQGRQANERPKQFDDLLVEDPVCHTYIPQKEAQSLKLKGAYYYFCSKECLQKFINLNKGD